MQMQPVLLIIYLKTGVCYFVYNVEGGDQLTFTTLNTKSVCVWCDCILMTRKGNLPNHIAF